MLLIQFTPQVELPPPPLEVALSWSDDGGHNFFERKLASAGAIGQTAQRVVFRRIGSTRRGSGLDRVFELSSETVMPTCLVNAVFLDE